MPVEAIPEAPASRSLGSISYAQYAALPAVNYSTLKEMKKSPLHYRHRLDHPRHDTRPLLIGRAVHAGVFEPDVFGREFIVWDGHRVGKAWKQFAADHQSQTILTADEMDTCLGIRDAVRKHECASILLADGKSEQSIVWEDPETGLPCKARIDHAFSYLIDLKTTKSAAEWAFQRVMANMGYHIQLAFYREGLSHTIGQLTPAYLIAAEQEPPHDVVVYEVTEEALALGWAECRKMLAQIRDCQRAGIWPGRQANLVPYRIDLPAYMYGPENEDDVPALTVGEEQVS